MTAESNQLTEKMSSKSKTKSASRRQTYKEDYSKKWTCIAASRKGEHFARCTLCSCDISIAHGGASDIKLHVQSSKHHSAALDVGGSSSITKFLLPKDNATIRAETLMTQFIIEHNLPMAVADHLSTLMKVIFQTVKLLRNLPAREQRRLQLDGHWVKKQKVGIYFCHISSLHLMIYCVHIFINGSSLNVFTSLKKFKETWFWFDVCLNH